MPRESTLFEDAIDVPLWLEADGRTPYAERALRDREIARHIARRDRIARVREWWNRAAGSAPDGAGARLERLRTIVTIVMGAAGSLTGVAVALAAFAYDGSQPVNVVRLLALLVGVQLVLLVLTLLLLPGRVPGLRHIQDLLMAVNPGSWAAAVYAKLAHASRPDAAQLVDVHAPRPAARRFLKWQLLHWSQTAAVMFNVAALVTAVMLVTFSDLAFGWSTTLDVDAATVSRIVHAIAWPWSSFAPLAVPSPDLVEQSQFFRLDRAGIAAGSPRALGAWWPFTLLALVTYGLLPRLLLLVLAAVRLRTATGALLLDDARVTALLDRMASPAIETAAEQHDEPPPLNIGIATATSRPMTGSARALIWENSLPPDAARSYARRALGLEISDIAEAGAGRLATDRAALEHLATDPSRTLVVFTPAWEPPLLELRDFLTELRQRIGPAASIVVAPVPDGPRAVTDVERATWHRAIAQLADPKLYLETGAT
jgi:hypothetical protein